MLVVDSSVWIDFFNDTVHPAVEMLDQMLDHGEIRLVVPDLVLFEVLRGFRHEHDHRQARRLMESLHVESTGGTELALAAAQHYRSLRAQGITVRSSIDVLIGRLRRKMMENGDTIGLIKTIRNIGYSLAADVRRRRLGPAGLPSDGGEALAS